MPRYSIATHASSVEFESEAKTPLAAMLGLELTRWENRSWVTVTNVETGEPIVFAIDAIEVIEELVLG